MNGGGRRWNGGGGREIEGRGREMVREEVIGRGGAVAGAGADLVLRLMSNRGLKMHLNGVSLLKKIDR